MFRLLRRRGFALLWSAGLISAIGDSVLFIALPFYVYDRTGSVLAGGAMFVVETVPRMALASVAGVFVDRWDRRRTMIVGDLLRAFGLIPLLLLPTSGAIWLIYVVAFSQAVFSRFFYPAKSALLPSLVEREELVQANALSGQIEASTALLGPMIGGALLAWLGLGGVVVADSASFLVSAALLVFIRVPALPALPRVEDVAGRLASLSREWREGIRVVGADPVIVGLFAVFATVNAADGLANVLFAPYARGVMGVGPVEFGWMISATGVGRLLGLFVVGRYGPRIGPQRLIVVAGLTAGGLMASLVLAAHSLPILLGLIILFSPGLPGFNVSFESIVQARVDDRFRGRVFGAWGNIAGLVLVLSMTISSALGDLVGITTMLAVSGAFYAAGGLAALVLLRGARRTLVAEHAAVG
jgi:MFS family permease